MLKVQQIQYYNWEDVQKFLCKDLGITDDQFRNYHEVVKGPYKDLWHVMFDLYEIENDRFITFTTGALNEYESRVIHDHGQWVKGLIDALRCFHKEVGDVAVVRFCW